MYRSAGTSIAVPGDGSPSGAISAQTPRVPNRPISSNRRKARSAGIHTRRASLYNNPIQILHYRPRRRQDFFITLHITIKDLFPSAVIPAHAGILLLNQGRSRHFAEVTPADYAKVTAGMTGQLRNISNGHVARK